MDFFLKYGIFSCKTDFLSLNYKSAIYKMEKK